MNIAARVKSWLIGCLLLCSPVLFAAEAIQDEWDDVQRLVVVGDIHGDYDSYFAVLRNAGLINHRGNWTGEQTHLVQVGDIPDRGPDTRRIIEHLQKLEKQAARAGGMVHVLIGNHEHMNVIGDLRYVTPGEYEAFTTRNSERYREAYWEQTVKAIEEQNKDREEPIVIDADYKDQWEERFPLGYVEHRLAWQAGGEINDWVSTHNSVIRINDMLFMHAGLGPDRVGMSIRQINDTIRAEILGGYEPGNSLGEATTGPLWYRGLARNPEASEQVNVDNILSTYGVDTIVVGHTPNLGVITPRFGGAVIITDTGISAYYGSHRASMLVEDGKRFALEDGVYTPLPADDEGIIPYFQAMAKLEPDNQRLARYLDNLLNPPAEEPTDDGESAATEAMPDVED